MFTNAFWVTASVSDTKCLVGEVVNIKNIVAIISLIHVKTFEISVIIEIIHDESNNSNNNK